MLEIDNETYKISSEQYYQEETVKDCIVIKSSMSHDMKFVNGWKSRWNGLYDKVCAFSIDFDGTIYQHFDPKYFAFFDGSIKDKNKIVINIVNEGFLEKTTDKKEFLDFFGRKYGRKKDPLMKKWRNKTFWAPYNDVQVESAIELIDYLFKEFDIKRNIIGHNTKVKNAEQFSGLLYRSNFDNYSTDLSPFWPYETVKEKLEI